MLKLRASIWILALAAGSSTLQASIILSEGFDNIATLAGSGWVITNNSSAGGSTSYFQGNSAIFPSQSGAATSYISANFNNAPFGGAISDWLITPQITVNNGNVLLFYTRTEVSSLFADTLEVRLSTSGSSTNVGATTTSTGDFTNLALSIDPSMTAGTYPADWTLETITLSGLSGPVSGRFGFRYLVNDTSVNGDFIGIDSLLIVTDVPEPGTLPLLLAGAGALAFALRKQRGFSI